MPLTLIYSISFLVALFVAWKQAKEKLYHERVIFDSITLSFVGIAAGARIIYVFFHFSDFGTNILKWVVFGLYPGFSIGGGLLGLSVVFWVLSDKKTQVPFAELADVVTQAFRISIPLFILGILSSGKGEAGQQLPWSIALPFGSGTLSIHPVTWYKFFILLVISAGVYLANKKVKLASGIPSVLFWFLLIMSYFFIDFLKRFDVYYWKFGTDQWVYLVLLLVLSIVLVFQLKRKAILAKK